MTESTYHAVGREERANVLYRNVFSRPRDVGIWSGGAVVMGV